MPINFLCDRTATNLAKEQVGFIDLFVLSAYDTISHYLPDAKVLRDRAVANKEIFAGKIAEYEEKRKGKQKEIPIY